MTLGYMSGPIESQGPYREKREAGKTESEKHGLSSQGEIERCSAYGFGHRKAQPKLTHISSL
jgi:hypothetical protein